MKSIILFLMWVGHLSAATSVKIPNHFCGLIYTWSPGMPISEKGISEIKNFALKNQIRIRFVTDPQIQNLPLELRSRDKYNGQYPAYQLMADAGYFNHFPGYFLQMPDGMVRPIRLGYIFPEDLELYLKSAEIERLCQ